jgi:hypothetical protein
VTPERRSFDRVDVAIAGGRVLRCELHREADGEPTVLTMAVGWRDPLLLDAGTLLLPAESLPDLRAALAALTLNTETDR